MASKTGFFVFKPIGQIASCYTQKFTIPRQPGLVKHAKAILHLLPEYSHPDIVRGLAQYSHIWVIFVFHKSQRSKFKNTVRPPRLGGNEKMGVFATRSNFRPNPIGQSAVVLDKIDIGQGEIKLHLSGGDFLHGTPVLDIKPYVPYADALPMAKAGMAAEPPQKLFNVTFSEAAKIQLHMIEQDHMPTLGQLIVEVLSYDARPAYYDLEVGKKAFSSQLCGYELKWQIDGQQILVTALTGIPNK